MESFCWTPTSYQLEKFTNEELYFIISSLLGLGYPGHGPESLHLSIRNRGELGDIRFLLLSKDLLNGNDDKEIVYFHLGQIDDEFNKIEIYSGRCQPEETDPEKGSVNVPLIRFAISEKTEPNEFHPVTFLNGLSRIISTKGFSEREENDLFKLFWNSPLPGGIKNKLDFGVIGPMGTNFSGDYFLVAQPDENEFGTTKVKSFKVCENDEDESEYIQDKIEVLHTFIDYQSAESYKRGETENISKTLIAN